MSHPNAKKTNEHSPWQQAHHAAVNRRWVRSDLVLDRVVVLVLVGCKDAVDLATNQPGLNRDLAAIALQ
jgi:hypothetical protein